MVSSDFGKLDVQRHLISGIDCAIAGFATAAAAMPTPAARRNSRRFIGCPPFGGAAGAGPTESGSLAPYGGAWRNPTARVCDQRHRPDARGPSDGPAGP